MEAYTTPPITKPTAKKQQRKGSYFEFPEDFARQLDAIAQQRGHPKVRVVMDVFNAGLVAKPALDAKTLSALETLVAFFSQCLLEKWGEKFSDLADEQHAPDAIEVIETVIKEGKPHA